MATTSTPAGTPTIEHQPSAPPDTRALFSRLAASMARHRRVVIGVWLVVAFAAAPLALTLTGALSGAGWEAQGSTAQNVRDELRKDFPALGAENPVVVYRQSAADRVRSGRPAVARARVGSCSRGSFGREPAHAAG